jgi:NADH-quinone oxidoreductase subunit I
MVESPHSIFPGMDEGDYYRGEVTQAAPGTVRQVAVSKGEKPDEKLPTEDAAARDASTVAPGGSTPAGTGAEA